MLGIGLAIFLVQHLFAKWWFFERSGNRCHGDTTCFRIVPTASKVVTWVIRSIAEIHLLPYRSHCVKSGNVGYMGLSFSLQAVCPISRTSIAFSALKPVFRTFGKQGGKHIEHLSNTHRKYVLDNRIEEWYNIKYNKIWLPILWVVNGLRNVSAFLAHLTIKESTG